jgi:hypothetical protein
MASGLSICVGGVGEVVLGAVADSVDLGTALYVAAAASLVAVAPGALLPSSRSTQVVSPASAM